MWIRFLGLMVAFVGGLILGYATMDDPRLWIWIVGGLTIIVGGFIYIGVPLLMDKRSRSKLNNDQRSK